MGGEGCAIDMEKWEGGGAKRDELVRGISRGWGWGAGRT